MASLRRAVLATALALGTTTVLVVPTTAAAAKPPTQRTYTYVDLGLLPGVNQLSGHAAARDINARGEVVGTTTAPDRSASYAYLFRDGQMTGLGSLDTGFFAGSFGWGINDSGDVVGYSSVTSTEPPHAMLSRNGTMIDLGTGFGSGSSSAAKEINSTGHIVGVRAASQLGTTRATTWVNGQIIDLPGLSSQDSEANAVNDLGVVVGSARTSSGATRAVMWVDHTIHDLGTLGNEVEPSIAEDISNTGAVVGRSTTPNQGVHAFLWRDGVMRDLGTFGGGASYAQGVNDHDQVVGVVALPGGPRDNLNRAVLFEKRRVIDLNARAVNLPADVTLASAFAINNTGVIVGNSCFNPCDPFQSVSRAFMLIPRS
jgi:probable HAF family extracellular repeat protein